MAGGWASLGLLDELVQSVEDDMEWMLPTDIQDECIPLILGGGDVMGSAETGSGKTAAFALPAIQLCYEHKTQQRGAKSRGRRHHHHHQDHSKSPACEFVMSTTDRDPSIAIDPNSRGLRVQSRDVRAWSGCRCAAGVKGPSGKFYFETWIKDDGIVRVGWAAAEASLELGIDSRGYGYGGTGMKVHNGKYDPYRDKTAFAEGDVIGCWLDFDEETVSFSKNGESLGKAFDLKETSDVYFPAICVRNAECEMNFNESNLRHLPEGFRGVAHAGKCVSANPLDLLALRKNKGGPFAIVIEPTRDLAEQTYGVFNELATRVPKPSVSLALLVGGMKPTKTLHLLQKNQIDILVGTPPIVATYMKKGSIKTGCCNLFILDEADELISKDSVEYINAIYSRLVATKGSTSKFDRLQVCFFSATLHSKEVRSLSEKLCQRPMWVDLRGQDDSIVPDTVHNCVVHLDPGIYENTNNDVVTDSVHRGGKLSAVTEWEKLNQEDKNSERIKRLKPAVLIDLIEKFKMDQALVFCRTNLDCDLLEKYLRARGGGGIVDRFTCQVLAGMRSMKERREALHKFKAGEVRILICTDVAARGIDIKGLPFVVNMMLPDKAETYVHRIGRVGRAERMGLAISLVGTMKEKVWFCRKGKKPPVEDTRLYDKGGNCIWYDEPKSFVDIQKLMTLNKVRITSIEWPSLNLPTEIKALVEGEGYGNYAGGGTVDPEMEAKMKRLEGKVKTIGLTEFALQSEFWKLRDRFWVGG